MPPYRVGPSDFRQERNTWQAMYETAEDARRAAHGWAAKHDRDYVYVDAEGRIYTVEYDPAIHDFIDPEAEADRLRDDATELLGAFREAVWTLYHGGHREVAIKRFGPLMARYGAPLTGAPASPNEQGGSVGALLGDATEVGTDG